MAVAPRLGADRSAELHPAMSIAVFLLQELELFEELSVFPSQERGS